MKLISRFLLAALIAGFGFMLAPLVKAQDFTVLITLGPSGASPYASLILSSNTLYGTTSTAGIYGDGTMFSLSLASVSALQLTIIRAGTNVSLTWPGNTGESTLQSTTNLASPAAWTSVSPEPVLLNGQNTVTNPISGTQTFYRLIQ
jgi:hypothetical protein